MKPNRMPWIAAIACAAVAALPGTALRADTDSWRLPKKLIATGWDKADTKRLRENIGEMEKRPFDGVMIDVVGQTDDGKAISIHPAHSAVEWKREWFKGCIEDLKAIKFHHFTDNFVSIGANPGNVDWFDDAGWKNIVNHWRIAAWIARQSGFKGVLFDPEPYTKPFAQFNYQAQPQHDKHSFNDYYAKARQRGREVMQAVAEEYPAITVYCYFMNSVNISSLGSDDPRPLLAQSGYGLYPAFIDGWLDAATPSMTFVDGCESAYRYNSEQDYLTAAVKIRGACQELVSPENRAKYRAQVQVSYGVYLDAYVNPPTSPWYIDGKGSSRTGRLRINVTTALATADEYVWIYGEKYRWWPTPNGGVNKESWPEALPGCDDALQFARDPIEYARLRIASLQQSGKLVNLTRNGDFSSATAPGNTGAPQDWKEGGAPAGWSTGQTSDSHGVFAWDKSVGATAAGSARAAGVQNGCFIQAIDVKPGERYAVTSRVKLQGKSEAWIRVRWQTADNKWTREAQDVMIPAESMDKEWWEIFGVATVPEDVGKLVILLGMANQSTPADIVWFDNVRLYRLN